MIAAHFVERAGLGLEALLVTPRDPVSIVAITSDGARRWADFLDDTAAVMQWLEAHGARRCLVASDCAYDVAVSIIAAAEAGCAVLLPANLQPDHLSALARFSDGVLGTTPVASKPSATVRQLASQHVAGPRDRRLLDVKATEVWIHTSGSTGAPTAVVRPLQTLAAEVKTLEASFGAALGSGPVVGTVPPYHIYGLLFRVLWPLVAGRPIDNRLLRYPPELMARTARAGPPVTVVSSPAFLTRALPVLDTAALAHRVATIFSSGGPLAADVGAEFNTANVALVEVYGSTETGGIAYRCTHDAAWPAAWTPFRGVSVRRSEEGQLIVRSPHQYRPGDLSCPDRISPLTPDGRFELLGRADRIVKIEENRLSLDDVERHLATLPYVADVRFVVLERRGRTALGAVIVPSVAGWALLAAEGRASVVRRLSAALASGFAPAARPRQWRLVQALPTNAQGKTTIAALQALFAPQVGRRTELTPVSQELGGNGRTARLRLRLEPDLAYFDGHFADHPVLPGVAQIGWAIAYGRALFGITVPFVSLEAIKFFRIATAGAELDLELGHDPSSGKLTFSYTSRAGQHSSGRIVFGERP